MSLPHIQNSTAGRNKFEPVYQNLFQVKFTLPEALRAEFGKDELLLTEHVLSINGLDGLNRVPAPVEQKFMGTTRSYAGSKLDSTAYEIEVKFTINLRNAIDNYIYELFRAWAALHYDIHTGAKDLKVGYTADWLSVAVGNRIGDVFHEVVFKDVFLGGDIQYISELNYDTGEPAELSVKFRSDWCKEVQA